ncbi:hypothetical protein DTO195F2_5976 [Paecilomyces variotii]|nr:hypothetical protein DTO195F2_5976 [Paecilomyces variotii]KAJ9329798.1 hypothetical protein DTO027B3_285 [Paecilomyces variotii]KAJ9371153.1 hypothetical protein DTO282E5_4242 [Paecilomyces variotii]KAJ9395719.1 hypothetical protein DTO282F9_7339 [Paecilomyces variotii]
MYAEHMIEQKRISENTTSTCGYIAKNWKNFNHLVNHLNYSVQTQTITGVSYRDLAPHKNYTAIWQA